MLVIGANPTDAHPVFASQMKRRLREGAKLIVVDPRRIDLVRSPHVEAAYHLQLRPGTNVAVVNAIAHVVVTEGLHDEEFVRRALRGRRRLASSSSPGPRTRPRRRRARPASRRRAARRRAAVRDGAERGDLLRPRRHRAQPGLDDGHGHRQPRDGHRQHRPRRRRREPAARAEQRAGLLRHGLVPARAAGLPARVATRRCARSSSRCGASTIQAEPGLRIPNMFDAALGGPFQGLYVQGEDIAQSDPNTQHVTAALRVAGVHHRAGPVPQRDGEVRARVPAGHSFLEKDGTFTNAERRIKRVRKVMPLAGRKDEWEVVCDIATRMGYPMSTSTRRRSWTRSPPRRRRSRACPSSGSTSSAASSGRATTRRRSGTPTMHVGEFVRGKGRFVDDVTCRPTSGPTAGYPLS